MNKVLFFVVNSILLSGLLFTSCEAEQDLTEINRLQDEKKALMTSVDSLQTLYQQMVENSDTLTAGIEKANALIEEKEAELKKMTAKGVEANKTAETLKAEIAVLKETKAEFENIISALKNEITRLNVENAALSDDLTEAEGVNLNLQYEIDELKTLLRGVEAELDQRRIDGVKAANIRFEVLKSGNKPTSSNNRARTFAMDFDLNKVPAQVQGETTLYFVIKDAMTGVPVKSDNPIKANIKTKNAGTLALIAQESKQVNLGENQRLGLRHDIQTKLKKGSYRALVYSDLGLIGAVSFRLR